MAVKFSIGTLEQRTKDLVPRPIRAPFKPLFRAYGITTSPWRALPDFLIIGAKRGGTTSLFNYLLEHPMVAPLFPMLQNIKGVHFFDTGFHKGTAWYRSHFPTNLYRAYVRRVRGRPPVIGEASPYYLFHPHAAKRARRLVPNAKLIVLLRNPVDRAYSHYRERRQNGVEHLSFEDALAREPERLDGELARMLEDESYYSFSHEHFSYRSQGLYLDPLKGWMERFPLDRFCIIRSEDLFLDPGDVYQRVLEFLGLPSWGLLDYKVFNFLPAQRMDSGLRSELTAFFAPHNRRLAEYLGMDLAWDDQEI